MKPIRCILLLLVVLAGCSGNSNPVVNPSPAAVYYSLSVMVQDSSGHAIPEASVILRSLTQSTLATGITDSTGRFEQDSLQDTLLTILATKSGYYATEQSAHLTEFVNLARITLSYIYSTHYYSLRVIVTDSIGRAIPIAEVGVYTHDNYLISREYTDSSGTLQLDSLPDSTVRLRISKVGYVSRDVPAYLTDSLNEIQVHLMPAEPDRNYTLRIAVVDSGGLPVPETRIDILSVSRQQLWTSGITDSSGSVQVTYRGKSDALICASNPAFARSERQHHFSDSLNDLQIELVHLLEFSVTTIDSEQLDGRDLLGRVVVIEFWDTWCGPCQRQLETFRSLDSLYGDGDLLFIGAALGYRGVDAVRDYVQQHGITFPITIATDDFESQFGNVTSIPTTFVIDRSGNLAFSKVGVGSAEWWTARIDSLLHP